MKVSISGIRGIVGEDLDLKDVMRYCGSFAGLVDSGKCVLARDTRPSGPMIKNAASAALMQNGIDVFDLGMAPTPVAFYESQRYGAGLVVSSSHNPIEWNGLKFITGGRGINEGELQRLVAGRGSCAPEIGTEVPAGTNYVEKAREIIGPVDGPPSVVVDAGGGAARYVAPELLGKLGCKVRMINETPECTSRGPDPTAGNLGDLEEASLQSDIGFAFDLDADRLVIVLDGKRQSPDVTLGLGVARALELGYKKFVLSLDTSIAVERIIERGGGRVHRSKVGEANVIDVILKTGSQAGGEGSSGGFILPGFNLCRDGILTSGLVASMLGTGGLEDALSVMDGYCQIRAKFPSDSARHDRTLGILEQRMRGLYGETITMDGIKCMIDDDTWVLVRKSNTEDIMRISAESDSPEGAGRVLSQTRELVARAYEDAR